MSAIFIPPIWCRVSLHRASNDPASTSSSTTTFTTLPSDAATVSTYVLIVRNSRFAIRQSIRVRSNPSESRLSARVIRLSLNGSCSPWARSRIRPCGLNARCSTAYRYTCLANKGRCFTTGTMSPAESSLKRPRSRCFAAPLNPRQRLVYIALERDRPRDIQRSVLRLQLRVKSQLRMIFIPTAEHVVEEIMEHGRIPRRNRRAVHIDVILKMPPQQP